MIFNIRLKEISAKYESQKEQLNETSKTIEKMRAELSMKDVEIETYNNR